MSQDKKQNAQDSKLGSHTGNGNFFGGNDSKKSGGAEKGGPGAEHAKANQPKDAIRPKTK